MSVRRIKFFFFKIENIFPWKKNSNLLGGMPEVMFYTRRRYLSGIIGCISEIVLTGELRLSLNPEKLGTAHNVEPGIFWE